MKKNKVVQFLTVVCFTTFLLMGQASIGFSQGCDDPKALTFSIVPAMETMQDLALYEPVLKHLKNVTGKEINFYMPTSRASVIEAMMNKFVDIAVHGPYSYIIANEKDKNIEVFCTYAKKAGIVAEEGPGYKCVIITKKGSKFTTLRVPRTRRHYVEFLKDYREMPFVG